MDWQLLIGQFEPLKTENVMLFAAPREMEQAVNTYNHAIFNVNHDSLDIALIALRKLAATYAMFGQAALLLGCCQAMLGQYDEAAEQFDHALLSGLPDEWQDQAQMMRDEVESQRKARALLQATGNGNSNQQSSADAAGMEPKMVSAGVVLEKTRRTAKVRMASEKERQSVMRQGEFPDEKPTHVQITREPVEYLRLAIPIVAGLAVVILLILAGVRWLPGLFPGNQARREAAARLDWLTDRLERLAGQDSAVSDLMKEYQGTFDPTPVPVQTTVASESAAASTSQAATAATTVAVTTAAAPATEATSQPTVTPTMVTTTASASPTAALDAAAQSLQQASLLYQEARTLQSSDLGKAGSNLLAARSLLTGIPGGTTAPAVSGDAAALSRSVESLITGIGRDAAEALRVPGMDEFNNKNYVKALDYFRMGYQLYPKAYGGGVAYYCGRCYQLLGDKQSAKPYFEYVIANFAGRDIAVSAASRLNEMGY